MEFMLGKVDLGEIPENFWECNNDPEKQFAWIYNKLTTDRSDKIVKKEAIYKFMIDLLMQIYFPTELMVGRV